MNPLIKHGATGHDWKKASEADRKGYCDFHAKSLSKVKPITGQFLYEALEAFYDTQEKALLDNEIIHMMALTLAAKGSG